MTVLDNFISGEEYARLCGVPLATAYDRVKKGHVCGITVCKKHFVDISKSPPRKRVNPSKKHLVPRPVLPPGIVLNDLVTVKHYARGRKMRCDSFYVRIILGKLDAVVIANSIFVNRNDPDL